MNVFRFMLKKDMRLWLVCTAAVLLLSGVIQALKYREAYANESYYSQAFEKLSESENIYEKASAEYAAVRGKTNEAYSQIFAIMYGADVDFSQPPPVIPSELMEQLFIPDKSKGKYAPTVHEDEELLSKLTVESYSQSVYRDKINEQLENYDRNVRRGVKDEYILSLAKKLGEDYTSVLDRELENPVDTRGANVLLKFMREDLICFLGIFILMFHIFSSEIQSGRYAQFSVTKFGAARFARAKMVSGFVQSALFCVVYSAAGLLINFIFSKDANTLFAPVQVLDGYELCTENITVLTFFLAAMGLKSLYCIALSAGIMLISYLCKRTAAAAGCGIILTAVPLITAKTYDIFNCDLQESKLKIILSCDLHNMFSGINYVNIAGQPIKLYLLYIGFMVLLTVLLYAVISAVSAKRGAVNV
ncbi:MAG: hypothetical protein ACI4JW_03665 [Oscillospiraceae bacterium]